MSQADQQPSEQPRPTKKVIPAVVRELLQRCADKLPAIFEVRTVFNEVDGADLLDNRISEVKSGGLILPVFAGKKYKLPAEALYNVNHYEKLKKYFEVGELMGVYSYLKDLEVHQAEMAYRYPNLFDQYTGRFLGIKDGTQMQVSSEYLASLASKRNSANN